ncbi:hypothetical protein LCGC14_0074840 [marine sediment metagenome]|uniref:Uncharacterized protein n=1 Tax=marine sediment metagenome TaxID=412755 RepID=A0A0F9W0T6_9ZZZZ|nr:hypothetical protein [Halomonas sp.]HDZ48749.1 hypothetical protein [Halomonas sp.]HEB02993.1 hypothetical protein [Halomonas sp.]
MRTYSDAHIEHYADRFIALRMARHGVNLAQYLINPVQFERLALEPEPLLPAQAAAVLRIWQRWDTGLAEQAAAPASEPETEEETFELPGVYAVWEEFLLGLGNNKAIRQRNGAFIEPLNHHRHNRGMNRGSANFERKQARKGT